jgi:two-component system cell cycle sensor histidine kinase/response regulator CckA
MQPDAAPERRKTNPSLVHGRYSIRNLVDIDRLRRIFEKFSRVTGFGTAFVEYPSQEVLIATGWREICTKFHRAFPESLEGCRQSNSHLTAQLRDLRDLSIRKCRNGLMDGATPIIIKGKHLAYVATGQVFFEKPDLDWFKRQAEKYGYAQNKYLEAVARVPVVAEAQFKEVLAFLCELAGVIAEKGLKNLEARESSTDLEREVASRRSMEKALRRAEEKYRSIFENAVEGIFQTTPEGRCIGANPAMARMLGYKSPEELLAHITDIQNQIYVDPHRRADFKYLIERDRFVKDFEYQVRRKDGSTLWVSENARAVPNDEGEILYYEGFVQDVAERKEAEALSKTLIMNSPVGIYIIQEGKFQLANQCFKEITAYSKEDYPRVNPMDLVHPDDQAEVRQKAVSMLTGKSSTPYEYRHVTKDGQTKWIMETVTPTQWKGKRATLGYFMDVTQHKQLESQFIQAQKMEAVGRLAGGVAHDFNNLLMAIMCYSEMIRGKLREADPLAQYTREILRASKRAISLIRQLLAFSSKQILSPEVFNLNDIVLEISGMLQRLIGEDVDLVTQLDPELGLVEADPGQIEQVIMNLAVNARDAMPHGGRLLIETANEFLHAKKAREYSGLKPGSHVVLTVSDTGMGMDAKTQSLIFEPFFTTKDPGKGTGLGLATVYGIVKQTGSHIEVRSEPGKGATFKIYFPQVEETAARPKVMEPATGPLHGRETILVVEDDLVLRAVIAVALRNYGYEVLEAGQGIEALKMYGCSKRSFDLLLTDVVMPKMSGGELARRFMRLYPDLKVLFMSGYAENCDIHPGKLAPGTYYLQKPFEPATLAQKVREILNAPPLPPPSFPESGFTPNDIVYQ